MDDARALAARLRTMAEDYAEPDTNDGEDYRPDQRAGDLLTAADLLDRLAAPEGVGLTRYHASAASWNGTSFTSMAADPKGEWDALKAALEWYGALPKEWEIKSSGLGYGDCYLLGEKARAALSKTQGGG